MKTRFVIGYYDDSRGPGGTTRYLMEILRCLDRERFCPLFFAPCEREWHMGLRDLGVEVITGDRAAPASSREREAGKEIAGEPKPPRRRHRLSLPPTLAWTAGLARETAQLVQLFRSRPLDLLHTNNAGAEPAPVAARLARVPRVLGTWHVDSTYDLAGERNGLRYRLLERAGMKALHHAISVSEATRQNWVARCRLDADYQKRISVIHNGIDPRRIQRQRSRQEARAAFGLPQDALLAGSLGRLDTAKGYEYLLRALPKIIQNEPRVHLVLAGSGPLAAELLALAQRLGISSGVHFLGFVADVRAVLECLDIYVQPSLCEALPFSVLEAAAFGLPIIASSVGGMPEAVAQGRSGLLVPPKDPDALAQAVLTLTQAPALRETMGQEGQARVFRDFTCDGMVAKTVAVYEHMLCRTRE